MIRIVCRVGVCAALLLVPRAGAAQAAALLSRLTQRLSTPSTEVLSTVERKLLREELDAAAAYERRLAKVGVESDELAHIRQLRTVGAARLGGKPLGTAETEFIRSAVARLRDMKVGTITIAEDGVAISAMGERVGVRLLTEDGRVIPMDGAVDARVVALRKLQIERVRELERQSIETVASRADLSGLSDASVQRMIEADFKKRVGRWHSDSKGNWRLGADGKIEIPVTTIGGLAIGGGTVSLAAIYASATSVAKRCSGIATTDTIAEPRAAPPSGPGTYSARIRYCVRGVLKLPDAKPASSQKKGK